jgi:RNA ligase (TIGR02306 family)
LLPVDLVEEFGYAGKLSGPLKNRVKAIRLRGELSQGLVIPWRTASKAAAKRNASLRLRTITQVRISRIVWVSRSMSSRSLRTWRVVRAHVRTGSRRTPISRILRKIPNIFTQVRLVVMTEKIHGTNFGVGMTSGEREMLVSSRRLVLEREETNLYWRAAIAVRAREVPESHCWTSHLAANVIVWGEIYGAGIQNLAYGGESG